MRRRTEVKLRDVVISIPHASTEIPPDIRRLLPHADNILAQEADLYTDRIYAVDGVRIVQAPYSRIVSDVNRAPDELYTEGRHRAEGVVLLSLSHGLDAFAEDPSMEMMEEWVRRFHEPFHRRLDEELRDAAFLIDGHSYWSVSPPSHADAGTKRPSVNLGNRLYTTCDARTMKFAQEFFQSRSYDVSINEPYMGRYVIGTHCSRLRVPGIQIEFNRSLYMDEVTLEANEPGVERLRHDVRDFVHALCDRAPVTSAGSVTDMSDDRR